MPRNERPEAVCAPTILRHAVVLLFRLRRTPNGVRDSAMRNARISEASLADSFWLCSRGESIPLKCEYRSGSSSPNLQFRVNSLQVLLDRPDTDSKPARNNFVGISVFELLQDFPLPIRQSIPFGGFPH